MKVYHLYTVNSSGLLEYVTLSSNLASLDCFVRYYRSIGIDTVIL